jgi:putative ABC transport system substrate-binding protein
MRRRAALRGLLSAPFWPVPAALAQAAGRLPKLAILSPAAQAQLQTPTHILSMLLGGLAEFGYVDGQDISFEFRFASHALERLPGLAAELVALQPDVMYTWTSGGARAAAAATDTIPIVVAPVNEGTMAALVSDFAQPTGNVTGLTLNNREQQEKCLQLLKEAAPGVTRVGVLLNPLNPVWDDYPGVLAGAAQALHFELVRVEARSLAEIDQAFAAMVDQGVDALFGLDESTLVAASPVRKRILELILEHRLPAVSDHADFAREGGLLALGTDLIPIARGAARYIHRILQGAKVSELPVEHPAKFKLIVNLETAEQLGIAIQPSILLRADEVIE